MKDEREYESPYKYTHYGSGYGKRFSHELYDEYLKKIDKNLRIMEPYNELEERDIIETLRLSLHNKKDFYTNAKFYMKKIMEKYDILLNLDVYF